MVPRARALVPKDGPPPVWLAAGTALSLALATSLPGQPGSLAPDPAAPPPACLAAGAAEGAAAPLTPAGSQDDEQLSVPSLDRFVRTVKGAIAREGSERFVQPSEREMEIFVECMRALLEGKTGEARLHAEGLSLRVETVLDAATGKTYIVAREDPAGTRGAGTYIVNPRFERNLIVGVPHPLYDVGTPDVGRRIFEDLGARALFIAGAHRCASATTSDCSGTFPACGGGPPRISDVAHNARTFFQAAHRAALNFASPPRALSIHGQSSEPTEVIISDGTALRAPAAADVNRLRSRLLESGLTVRCCNAPDEPESEMCGSTNVQGRLYNGSADPCRTPARKASGLFLHIEQSRSVRDDPLALIAALKEVIPAEMDAGRKHAAAAPAQDPSPAGKAQVSPRAP